MKLNELVRNTPTWTSNEEKTMLAKVNDLMLLNSFPEREQAIIENLVRKSLLIRVVSKDAVYVYPNT